MTKVDGLTSHLASIVNLVRPTMVQVIALSVQLFRAKLTARRGDRRAVAKFSKCAVYDKVPREIPRYLNVLITQCTVGHTEPPCQKPAWFTGGGVSIEHRLTCDIQRQTDTGPRLVA